ncbi:hypothetical protein QP868_09990, partial [Brevibacterium sp. UMB1308A]|uniref:hypothetical protein n=1 Tax=Brevibacterium sp. UMB1308A TaxID=3050608 RepID=UPI002550C250
YPNGVISPYFVTYATVLGAFRYSRRAKPGWTVSKYPEATTPHNPKCELAHKRISIFTDVWIT